MNCPSKIPPIVWAGISALLVASASFGASAQELEARAYSPAPVGVNFLGLGYLRSTVTRTGLADPRLRLAVNLFGGPALDREGFAAREPSTTLGASLMVVAPFGKYDSDRLINLGSNRWAFKPEIGVYGVRVASEQKMHFGFGW